MTMTVKMTMMRAMMVMLIDRLTGMAASAHAAVTLRDFGLVFAVVVLVVVELVVGGASVQFWRIVTEDDGDDDNHAATELLVMMRLVMMRTMV